MAMIEINLKPSASDLRWFGAIFALFFAIVGGFVRWKFGAPLAGTVIGLTAAGLTLLYYRCHRSVDLSTSAGCMWCFRSDGSSRT